jgi:creatinine amidohydrolase/Fe(II)-dependent formamide hydrolase-like protein
MPDVMEGLQAYLALYYCGDDDKVNEALSQFTQVYIKRQGIFELPNVRKAASEALPVRAAGEKGFTYVGFWVTFGYAVPAVAGPAITVLSQAVSISASERGHKLQKFIQSKTRNRMAPEATEKAVLVHASLRSKKRGVEWADKLDAELARQVAEEEDAARRAAEESRGGGGEGASSKTDSSSGIGSGATSSSSSESSSTTATTITGSSSGSGDVEAAEAAVRSAKRVLDAWWGEVYMLGGCNGEVAYMKMAVSDLDVPLGMRGFKNFMEDDWEYQFKGIESESHRKKFLEKYKHVYLRGKKLQGTRGYKPSDSAKDEDVERVIIDVVWVGGKVKEYCALTNWVEVERDRDGVITKAFQAPKPGKSRQGHVTKDYTTMVKIRGKLHDSIRESELNIVEGIHLMDAE